MAKKLRLANIALSTVLFLILFARAFYLVGKDDTAGVDWLLCVYYFAVTVVLVVCWHKIDCFGKFYFIGMAVLYLLLPIILWIYIIIDCLVDGFGQGYLVRNWHLVVATVFAVVMTIFDFVGAVWQKYNG